MIIQRNIANGARKKNAENEQNGHVADARSIYVYSMITIISNHTITEVN